MPVKNTFIKAVKNILSSITKKLTTHKTANKTTPNINGEKRTLNKANKLSPNALEIKK